MHTTQTRATLITLCSISLAAQSYGELIIIRHPPKMEKGVPVQDLTCKSENDGSAMVWNQDPHDSNNDMGFKKAYPSFGECSVKFNVQSDKCIPWQEFQNEWRKVYSDEFPVAPVFDYRWEGFKDYKDNQEYNHFKNLTESGSIVFSARGFKGIDLRLGDENTMANNSCFRIKFPSRTESSVPTISSCHNKGHIDRINSTLSPNNLERSLVNALEWRTYIIEWKSQDKIEAFHGKKSLVRRKIDGSLMFKRLFVESVKETRVRFHVYEYAKTDKHGVEIHSHDRNLTKNNLDLNVLVSLCPECHLDVHVVDGNNTYLVNKTIHFDKTFSQYKSPFWQFAELNLSWNVAYKNPVKFKMITKKEGNSKKGMWAIGSALNIKSKDKMRQSTRKFTPSNNVTDLPCQKLSYEDSETSIVHSNGKISNVTLAGLHQCLTQNTGICDFGCGDTCKETSICNPDGCTCAPGFRGDKCDQECRPGWYGYNCRTSCECGGHTCHKIKGTCSTSECREYYLPSSCKKKLEPPHVSCINETKVLLSYNVSFDENEIKHLRFEIKKVGDEWKHLDIHPNQGESKWYWSNESIEYLELSRDYKVRAVINATHGEEGTFDTKKWRLSKPQDLTVTPMPNGTVILKWRHYPYVWEKIKLYEVQLEFLGVRPSGQTLKLLNMTSHAFVTGKDRYEVKLNLSIATNYTFFVKAMSKFGNSTVRVVYVIPNEGILANIKIQPGNSKTKQLNFTVPISLKNDSNDTSVNLAMKNSPRCPRLITSQKTDTVASWILELKTGDFPACTLNHNLTYVFTVQIDDEDSSKLRFCWFIIIPIGAIVWAVIYILYRRHKADSLPINFCNPKFSSLQAPEDNTEEQKVRNFENYVKRAAENGLLQQQFVSLPRGMVRSCEYGKLPENEAKNRYKSLIAYDETRVLLAKDSSGIYSDYINANYVQGYCKEKAYIATQGPLPNTVLDFWRMIWQEEVRIICMLVDLVEDGKNMCERYWPDVGEKKEYGEVVVLTTKQSILADYTYRTFLVTTRTGRESQLIEHLQYTGWPGDGVPMYSHSVVEYLQKLLSVSPGQGPIVVHCNSGTGRTGVIILCDICRRRLATIGTMDVFVEAKKMFRARGNMLRSYAQYVLAHLVPTQCLLMLPTKVLCAEVTQKRIEEMKSNIPAHMKRLAETSWMDKALRPIEPLKPTKAENILKNRFQKRTPVGPSLVTLTRYPTYDENSDYISAVTVDGVKIRKQYITSQLPMPSTLTDFWRLIVEKNVQLIVILQYPDPEDPTCCNIIPRGTVVPVPGLKVETQMTTNSNKYFTMDKLLITDISKNPVATRNITAMTCKNWNPIKNARPPGAEALAEIWIASEKIHRDGPTLVLCYDGLTGCGLYSALSFTLERMAVEQECDVVLAVRAVRRSRSDFVRARWQFEYLYDAAVKYTESFQDYSNWTGVVGSSQV